MSTNTIEITNEARKTEANAVQSKAPAVRCGLKAGVRNLPEGFGGVKVGARPDFVSAACQYGK